MHGGWRAVQVGLGIIAVVLLGIAALRWQDAREVDDATAELGQRQSEADDRVAAVDRQASRQVIAAYDVDGIVNDLLDESIASGDAIGALSDAMNHAVDQANAGDIGGFHQTADQEAGAALEDLRAVLGRQFELLADLETAAEQARPAAADDDGEAGR